MSRKTGKLIEGKEYLFQSIEVCLTTPKGSMLINKEFGSTLYQLIDSGSRDNASYAIACARALEGLSSEFLLKKVSLKETRGVIELFIEGDYLPSSELIRTRVLL